MSSKGTENSYQCNIGPMISMKMHRGGFRIYFLVASPLRYLPEFKFRILSILLSNRCTTDSRCEVGEVHLDSRISFEEFCMSALVIYLIIYVYCYYDFIVDCPSLLVTSPGMECAF